MTRVEQRLDEIEMQLLAKSDDADLLNEKKALGDELSAILASIEEQDMADWRSNF